MCLCVYRKYEFVEEIKNPSNKNTSLISETRNNKHNNNDNFYEWMNELSYAHRTHTHTHTQSRKYHGREKKNYIRLKWMNGWIWNIHIIYILYIYIYTLMYLYRYIIIHFLFSYIESFLNSSLHPFMKGKKRVYNKKKYDDNNAMNSGLEF